MASVVIGLALAASPALAAPAHAAAAGAIAATSEASEQTRAIGKNMLQDPTTHRPRTTGAGDCVKVKASLARLAANGERRQALCFDYGTPDKTLDEKMRAATEITPTAIQPLPEYCKTLPVNGGWIADARDRTKECSLERGSLQVYSVDGVLVGILVVGLVHYSYTANNQVIWNQQMQILPLAAQGDLDGLAVQGTGSCSGSCQVTNSTFPSQSPLNGNPSGEATFRSTLVSGRASAQNSIGVHFTKPGTLDSGTIYFGPGPVRCDTELPGNISPGCIFPEIPPLMIYSLTGPFPLLAQHIYAAQQTNLPGAPGPNYADGRPLTRTTNSAVQTANRNRACRAASSGGYPRPAGHSCDEYPFASTYEGAEAQYQQGGTARTFQGCQIADVPFGQTNSPPIGWSVCMIPTDQNSPGGVALNTQLFLPNRVLDRDSFFVAIYP